MRFLSSFILYVCLTASQASAVAPVGASLQVLAPEGATIVIDRKVIATSDGTTAVVIQLLAGEHHILVRDGHCVLESTRVNLSPGSDLIISALRKCIRS